MSENQGRQLAHSRRGTKPLNKPVRKTENCERYLAIHQLPALARLEWVSMRAGLPLPSSSNSH